MALLLGITPRFTLMEALRNAKRLDQEFISTLVMEHSSGISVLASSDAFTAMASTEARTIGKLVDVFRSQYPYVVIDAGRGWETAPRRFSRWPARSTWSRSSISRL